MSYQGDLCARIQQLMSLDKRFAQFLGWMLDNTGLPSSGFADAAGLFRIGSDNASTANAFALITRPVLTSLYTGARIRFLAPLSCAASATLSPDGLAPKTFRKRGNEPVAPGDVIYGQIVDVEYDASLDSGLGGWALITPPQSELPRLGSPFQLVRTNAGGTLRENADPVILQVLRRELLQTDSTASTVTLDNSVPQISEGKEFDSIQFTPLSALSQILVEFDTYAGSNNSGHVVISLFKDSDVDAIASAYVMVGVTSEIHVLALRKELASPGTSTLAFSLRFGGNGGGTAYLNRSGDGQMFGGTHVTRWKITEYLP